MVSSKNYYRDIALPRNVVEVLVEDYEMTTERATELVVRHHGYIKKAYAAYPVVSRGTERMIAATVVGLRGGPLHGQK